MSLVGLQRGGRRDWGTNLARVKDFNEVVVLELVRANGPLGRPAIATDNWPGLCAALTISIVPIVAV